MSVADSRGALAKAGKELFARWADVQTVWHDAQSQEFQKVYITQIEQDLRTALGALDHMNQVLLKLENDCE